MKYIIDANNLAGKLNILQKEDFDKIVIDIIIKFASNSPRKVVLIFDGLDPMGDRFNEGGLDVVYTPKDNYYNGADDKIVEVIEREIVSRGWEGVTLITDDYELIKRVEKVEEESRKNLSYIKAVDFVKILKTTHKKEQEIDVEDEELYNELINIWK